VLYQIVRDHFETFRAEAARAHDGYGLPRFIEEEFRGFLGCGRLAGGFARFHCRRCGADRLVPFSWNIHLHALVLDGVYVEDGEGEGGVAWRAFRQPVARNRADSSYRLKKGDVVEARIEQFPGCSAALHIVEQKTGKSLDRPAPKTSDGAVPAPRFWSDTIRETGEYRIEVVRLAPVLRAVVHLAAEPPER
jgi:hypothetical protein